MTATCAGCGAKVPVEEIRDHRCWVSKLLDVPVWVAAGLTLALMWWVGA